MTRDEALFLEYKEVLKRPEQRLATGMDDKDIAGFMTAFAIAAQPVEVHFLWRPQLADPDHQIVLEAAVNDKSKAIITHNVRDFQPAARGFSIEVVTPGTFLKRIKP